MTTTLTTTMNSPWASPSADDLGDELSGPNRAFFLVRGRAASAGWAAWRARQPASRLGGLLVGGLEVGWLTGWLASRPVGQLGGLPCSWPAKVEYQMCEVLGILQYLAIGDARWLVRDVLWLRFHIVGLIAFMIPRY